MRTLVYLLCLLVSPALGEELHIHHCLHGYSSALSGQCCLTSGAALFRPHYALRRPVAVIVKPQLKLAGRMRHS
jgi:hypothetical protein